MGFYSGIDLSARDNSICVIDEQQMILKEKKLRNELRLIIPELEPYKKDLNS